MNFLIPALLTACLVLIQCLIGGTRLVFSLPAYALVAAAAVLSVFWVRRPGVKAAPACLVSTLLLAGYVFYSVWVAPVPYLARTDGFMAAGALLVYLLTAVYLHDSRSRLWIASALLLVGVVHVAVSLMQFEGRNGFMLFGFIRMDTSCRASGMLISGNHLAGYLESVGLIALGITVWSRCSLATKLLTGYITAFCYLGVALSGSRGGYLSSIFSLVVFGALSVWIIYLYKRSRIGITILGTVAAGLLILCTTGFLMTRNPFIHDRVQRIQIASKDVRVYNWLATLDQFKLNPVWGTGPGTHLYYGRLFRRPQIQSDPVHSHGDYLELLAEYGIVGELLALAFLITHLSNGVRSIREITLRRLCNSLVSPGSDSLALTLGATAAVAALMAHSVVDFNMHIPSNALLFAFLFGLLGNTGIDHKIESPTWASPGMALRVGLVLLGVATLAGVGYRYQGEARSEKARVALRKRDYQLSIQQAAQAIKDDPSNPHPYFYQGEAYRLMALRMKVPALRSTLFENAVAAFRNGLKLFPQDESFLVRLGQALDGVHRFEEADQAYLSALRWDPNMGILYSYYAAHLHLTGQEEAKKKYMEAAKQLGSNPETGMKEVHSILEFEPANPDQE